MLFSQGRLILWSNRSLCSNWNLRLKLPTVFCTVGSFSWKLHKTNNTIVFGSKHWHGYAWNSTIQTHTCRNVHLMTAKTEDLSQVNGWIRRLSVTKLFLKLKLVTDNCLLHSSRRANWEPNEGLQLQTGRYIYIQYTNIIYIWHACTYQDCDALLADYKWSLLMWASFVALLV